MKAWMHTLSLTAAITAPAAARADGPVLVPSPAEKVFVPLGFDDNDDVELVVHGHFRNTCFKTGPVSARVDAAAGIVEIDATAYHYRDAGCAQVLVPFTQPVRLGMVPSGRYRIVVKGAPDAESPELIVGPASTTSPDDHLYAPVAQVALRSDEAGGYAVEIAGEYPYTFVGCMVMREVRTYMSPGNTLVVMPIAALTDGPECDARGDDKSFSVTTPVGPLAAGEYVVHVRALEGSSLNRFVDLSN